MPDRGLVGRTFQNYRMDRFVGQGGMASVYQATDLRLQRPVAIKVMHPQYAGQDLFRGRFMQEARAIAALDHPNIVRVLSFDTIEGELFIIMELITGGSLRDYIKRYQESGQFIPFEDVISLTSQMADALYYAHQMGLIHRDIKPDNVVLRVQDATSENGGSSDLSSPTAKVKVNYQPVLTDFGLATLAESGDIYATDQPIGTYPYMSPEQCLAERVDTRSDIYGLGVMLYELTTLRLPYAPRSIAEAVRMHTREPIPKPSDYRPGLPAPIERIILKCLQKNPNDRFQNAAEVARVLRDSLALISAAPASSAKPMPGAVPTGDAADPLSITDIDALSTEVMSLYEAPEQPPYYTPPPVSPEEVGFDRLIIYNEAEPTVTITLNKNLFTIGRDSNRDVRLGGRRVSRRHARIERGFDGKYRVVDLGSTNGTFLGDAQLIPNIAEVWDQNVLVRLADYWMRIEPAQPETDKRPAGGMTELERPLGSLHVSNVPGRSGGAAVIPSVPPQERDRIGVSLSATLVKVAPGSRVTLALEITNQTKLVDHFTVSVYGIPAEWYTPPDQALYLLPGNRDTASVEFHPPLNSDSTAGQHAFEIRVSTRAQAIVSPAVQGALEISPFYDFLMDMSPLQIRRRAMVEVSITNTGNIATTYNITARDRGKNLEITSSGKQFTVMPGRSEIVDLKVRAKNRQLIGNTRNVTYEVIVEPREVKGSKSMTGEVAIPPYIPIMLLTALILIVAMCGIISALLVPPALSLIHANQTSVAQAFETATATQWTPTPSVTPTATQTPLPTETPTPQPTPTPFPTLFGSNGDICPGSPPSRLQIGLQARVTAQGLPNRLRAEPSLEGEILDLLQNLTPFIVIGGPTCDTTNFIRWWQVNANGKVGWTAEGVVPEYYLEPINGGDSGNAFPNPDG